MKLKLQYGLHSAGQLIGKGASSGKSGRGRRGLTEDRGMRWLDVITGSNGREFEQSHRRDSGGREACCAAVCGVAKESGMT